MSDLRQDTIDTYNKSAKGLAKYFKGIGARVEDIDRAFEAAGNPDKPRILEIGCGDGRDAKEIVKKAGWYLGFDISEELIKLARQQVPEATFEVADATSFDYPDNLDIVFAFASLLHLDKDETRTILQKVHDSLSPGGVFYISLKYAAEYEETIREDEFGKRQFYLYNPELITELAGDDYEVVNSWNKTIGHTKWFEIALRAQ